MADGMTSRERLMATLRGDPVDRPAVSFYEIGGIPMDPSDPDPFNIYNDPSWQPLLSLAEEKTDLIRMRSPHMQPSPDNCHDEFFRSHREIVNGSWITRNELHICGRTLAEVIRRDPGIDTNWTIEHLLKSPEDLELYLQVPDEAFEWIPTVNNLIESEQEVGERGIVMVDTSDPLCNAAALFSLQDYLLVAFHRPDLFHRLLEKCSRALYPRIEKVSREFPGRLWRIYGPEYATVPYLPPRLFEEYVERYTTPIVQAIQAHGGYARIHCHGQIRDVLPSISRMNPDALDPIEPPAQGDISLREVREQYGDQMVLFGNIEVSDIENMDPAEFEAKARQSIHEGTAGTGRGFVLMPTASPYGRTITGRTLLNYLTLIRLIGA
ncbi:MAG: methylcobalamin:coenzyme M methyltransferase [Candidatus Hinthialibacteria bacterium OLB16]|nr:MAG: methylcobalamin:coenzyme M methyltransferase [Candidatus Hinthialibacteria bacterium OLB16]